MAFFFSVVVWENVVGKFLFFVVLDGVVYLVLGYFRCSFFLFFLFYDYLLWRELKDYNDMEFGITLRIGNVWKLEVLDFLLVFSSWNFYWRISWFYLIVLNFLGWGFGERECYFFKNVYFSKGYWYCFVRKFFCGNR